MKSCKLQIRFHSHSQLISVYSKEFRSSYSDSHYQLSNASEKKNFKIAHQLCWKVSSFYVWAACKLLRNHIMMKYTPISLQFWGWSWDFAIRAYWNTTQVAIRSIYMEWGGLENWRPESPPFSQNCISVAIYNHKETIKSYYTILIYEWTEIKIKTIPSMIDYIVTVKLYDSNN